jgi:hypothetical protein
MSFAKVRERGQLLFGAYNEMLSIVAVSVNNPHRSSFAIHG